MICRWRSGISALASLVALGLCISTPGIASAAASAADNAIQVSPTTSNVTTSSNETSDAVTIRLTNLTDAPLHVGLSTQDFQASPTRAGAIQLFGSSYNPNTNPHGLEKSVTFPSPVILLNPKQSQKIVIGLNNLPGLAPGGHYGAILFTPQVVPTGIGKPNISISSSVASLIFLTTASGGTDTLNLTSFPLSLVRFSLPRSMYLAFRDSGNTQTSPQGQFTLYRPDGSIISTTVLNPGEGLVLPGTVRLFNVQLPIEEQHFAWPGIYRVELQYKSRTGTTFTVINKRFLYLNLIVVVPFLLLCILLIIAVRRYRLGIYKGLRWLVTRIQRPFKKKPTPQQVVEKPKKPTRLIQG